MGDAAWSSRASTSAIATGAARSAARLEQHASPLRKQYREEFAKGNRADTKLETVLKKENLASLHDLLKRER